MSLSVNAAQLTLAARGSVKLVPLVVLETFTDREAGTVDTTRYWTRAGTPVVYPWDGSNDQIFDPVIRFATPIDRGFDHLPDAAIYHTREVVRLELDGSPRVGNYLWQELLGENIIGARVTIASVLADTDAEGYDLGLSANLHVLRWRGEVTSLEEIIREGAVFSLVCETEEVKLGSTQFVPGENGADIPVILDNAANVPAVPNDVRHEATFVERTTSGSPLRYSILPGAGETVPDGPPATFYAYWTLGSTAFNQNVWYGVSQNGSRLDRFGWERVDDPGVNGGDEQDLMYIDDADTNAIEGDAVYIPKYYMRFALAAGYVRRLTALRISSELGRFSTQELVTTGATSTAWDFEYDETDPDNVITYLRFFPSQMPGNEDSAFWLELCWHEDVKVEADIESMLVAPSGSWTQEIDVSTWDIVTATATTVGRGVAAGGSEQTIRTWNGNSNESSVAASRPGSDIVVTSSVGASPYPLQTSIVFKGMAPTAGDREFRVTFNVDATNLAKLTRVHVYAFDQSGSNDTKGFASLRHNVGTWEAADLSSGDNVLTVKSFVDDQLDVLDRFSIVAIWNEDTSDKTFSITGDVESRALSQSVTDSHPLDIASEVISNYLPGDVVTVDATSFATAETNTPGVAVSPNLANYETLGAFLAAIGFAGRVNFVYSEASGGTVVKAYAAESDYDFPAAIRAIGDEFTDMQFSLRPQADVANRFTWLYDLIETGDPLLIGSYRSSLRATGSSNPYSPDVADSEFTDSEAAFGMREAIQIPISMIRDEASLLEVTGYYVKESLRGQVARYACRVPFWMGYDLEPGDVVSIQPSWESSNVKVRVLRVIFTFDEPGVGLVLEVVT